MIILRKAARLHGSAILVVASALALSACDKSDDTPQPPMNGQIGDATDEGGRMEEAGKAMDDAAKAVKDAGAAMENAGDKIEDAAD